MVGDYIVTYIDGTDELFQDVTMDYIFEVVDESVIDYITVVHEAEELHFISENAEEVE